MTMYPMMRKGSRKSTCRVFVMQNCTIMTSDVILDMMSPFRWSLKYPTFMAMVCANISLRIFWSVRMRMVSTVIAPA